MNLKNLCLTTMMYVMRFFPVKKKRLLFQSFFGKYYNDNPKAISDALRDSDCELIWIVDKPDSYNDDRICFVKHHSLKNLYYLATSKIWVDNCRKPIWVRKRKKQYYIQTWHAGISNKLGEKKTEEKLTKDYVDAAKHDSLLADLFVSNSSWLTNSYRESFWYDGEIIEKGLPREDILASNKEKKHSQICNFYKIKEDVKLILYAPTFRNDLKTNAYNIDYNRLVNILKEDGKQWKVIVRFHPNLRGLVKVDDSNNIIDASAYPEISDLIMASELVISDYSSCMFDAMLASRKVVLYANDLAKYENERGFAFKPEELPFPLATNNDELESVIRNFRDDIYQNKVREFIEKCGIVEVGNASKTIADHIMLVIDKA